MLKVYHAPETRSVRILWLLEELGLPYEVEKHALGNPSMRSPEYLAKHPLGRVPALEDDGVIIHESGAIVQYVLERYGNDRLMPAKDSEYYPAFLQWLHFAEGMLMPPVNTIVVETLLLSPERRNETNVKRATKLLTNMLGAVEQALESRDYLAGDFSGAEIMTGHATMAAVRFGGDASDKPNVQAYIKRLETRDALIKARSI